MTELECYFEEQIFKTVENQNINFSLQTMSYLSNLLTQSAFSFPKDRIYLVDLYKESSEAAGPIEKFRIQKRLGDYSLIVSGYFPDSLDRRLVGVDYYIAMGATAYGNISNAPGPFRELSVKYRSCVSVLNEISELNKHHSSKDIARLYDMWHSTKSFGVKRRLAELGMLTLEIEE
jgi:hypothetical protein